MTAKSVDYVITLHQDHLSKTTKHWDSFVSRCSKISMTFDTWTSLSGDPFLSVTAHYIDTPIDKPQQLVLKSDQLAFTPIVGNHSGANIGKILMEAIIFVTRYVS